MISFNSKEAYYQALEAQGSLPEDFFVATTSLEFFPKEKKSANAYKMNLSLFYTKNPTSAFSAMYTRNKFPGAPVIVGRELLRQNQIQGVVINNRISNVCAPNGVANAKAVASAVEKAAGFSPNSIIPASTGIIGWQIPKDEMIASVPQLLASTQSENGFPLAKAIMTTDSFPKLRSCNIGTGRIVAVAKGAGMIEPNLATMLCFVMTDIDISREELDVALKEAVNASFNRISIDSDQSTSDSVIMLSSCKKPLTSYEEFKQGLKQVLFHLACDIVRNGEGTAHVIRVNVNGFNNDLIALQVGKAVANSPLVKTAIYGNDPNVGRLLSSIGDFCGNNNIDIDTGKLILQIGNEVVYANGEFLLDENKEDRIYNYLKSAQLTLPPCGYPEHDLYVDIKIDCSGSGKATALGSDLSYDYIKENAEYRS